MKKAVGFSFKVLGLVFLTSMITSNASTQSSPKDKGVSKPISSSVMKIAEESCVKCHTVGMNKKALMHLNLSNWENYSPKKQAKKANSMCKMVSEGKMPPKGFIEKHPETVPTKDEIKVICDWATSIQVVKK